MQEVAIALALAALFGIAAPVLSGQSRQAQPSRGRPTPAPAQKRDSSCTPSAAELKVLAREQYAKESASAQFIRGLDTAVGFEPGSVRDFGDDHLNAIAVFAASSVNVYSNDDLSIIAYLPYSLYRLSLMEALRKREPIESVEPGEGAQVQVAPKQIDALDIIKVIVERDGVQIVPLSTHLEATPLRTRLGAERVLHSGSVFFPCSAFAPNATVVITAIPESGPNLVKVLTPIELGKLK